MMKERRVNWREDGEGCQVHKVRKTVGCAKYNKKIIIYYLNIYRVLRI